MTAFLRGKCANPECDGWADACRVEGPIPVFEPEAYVVLRCASCGQGFQVLASELQAFPEPILPGQAPGRG